MSSPKPPSSSGTIPSVIPSPVEDSKEESNKSEPGSLSGIEPDQTGKEPVAERSVSPTPPASSSTQSSSKGKNKNKKKRRRKFETPGQAQSTAKGSSHQQQIAEIQALVPELAIRPPRKQASKHKSAISAPARLKLGVKHAPAVFLEETCENLVRGVKRAIETEGESIYTHFINASLNLLDHNFNSARNYTERLLAEINPVDPMYSRALLLKGEINYFENMKSGLLTEDTAKAFQTAWLLGNSRSAKYYMASMMGIIAPRSNIKWLNLAEVVKVAARFPETYKSNCKKVSEITARLLADGRESQQHAAPLIAGDLLNKLQPGASLQTSFTFQLTEYFLIPSYEKDKLVKQQQHITEMLTRASLEEEIAGQFRAVLQYAVALKTQETDQAITSLTAKGTSLASHLLAGILLAKNPKCKVDAIMWLGKSSEHFPVAYEHLAEMSLRNGKFEEARDFYQKAVNHIEGFLSGKRPMMGLHIGQEAALYDPEQSSDTYKSMKLEEQSAAEQLQEKYQRRLGLLETLSPETQEDKSTDTSDTKSGSHTESGQAAPSSPKASPPATESVQTTAHMPVASASADIEEPGEEGWTVVRKRARTYGSESINNNINRAVELTNSASGLDEAERLLNLINPEENSLPYFQKQQSLCWINHERANPENYGKPGFVIPGRSSAKKYLNRAMIMATGNIQKLEGMTTATKTTGLSVRINEEECIKIAEELDAIDPGLRKKYGGFYSTLGHIQKALRGHCQNKKALNDCVQKGLDYYDMANFIRQRQPSQFAKPEQ